MAGTVVIAKDTLAFFIKECEQMHVLCDRVSVPRELEGCGLSMAERVAILVGSHEGLLKRYLKMEPPTEH